MKTRLFLIATIAILMLAARPCGAQTTEAELVPTLNAVGEGDWRSARPLAGELAGGMKNPAETLGRIWPRLEKRIVKTELVTAFLQSIHPDGLEIALLGLNDSNEEIRKGAVVSASMALGLPFEMTPEEMKRQITARKGMTLEAAREARAKEIIVALRSAKPGDVPAMLDRPASTLWRSKRLREISIKAGLFVAIRPFLTGSAATAATQKAVVSALASFDPPQAMLQDVLAATQKPDADPELLYTANFYLGQKRYRPAYAVMTERLKKPLTEPTDFLRYRPAEALAQFGEPETIPLLIGVIAADNNRSVYDVGYFALRPLTGVPYNELHDGAWWKLWWEAHKGELPENVRNLPIPDLPRSPSYKEPLPRAAHNDPTKLRDVLLARYQESLKKGLSTDASTLAALNGPAAIPDLIGLIASDNTSHSLYGVGYFALTPLTGVPYSPNHDANWWELWREAHKSELPAAIRDAPLPEFPRSPAYQEPLPAELHRDPNALRARLIEDLRQAMQVKEQPDAPPGAFQRAQDRVAALKDPRTVPDLIALLPEDPNDGRLYWLDYFTLSPLTGVRYVEKRPRAWWQNWWKENGTAFEKKYPPATSGPDFETLPYKPGKGDKRVRVAECPYDPEISPASAAGAEASEENPKDIADVPSVRTFAGGDKNKLYRLVGLDPKAPNNPPPPANGYSLLVVLPGGDGSEEFRWFIRRIKKNALPKEMIVAELVAPQWSEWQAQSLVWPTRKNPYIGMKFSTEEFIESVIADVKKRTKIAPAKVYTMAWSSSGPAVYTHLATKGNSIAGAFIAMSVFRENELPAPDSLTGKRVSLYHSPQDFIKIQLARDAETFLKSHGAIVRFEEYQGGHGWREDIYGGINRAITFIGSGRASGP